MPLRVETKYSTRRSPTRGRDIHRPSTRASNLPSPAGTMAMALPVKGQVITGAAAGRLASKGARRPRISSIASIVGNRTVAHPCSR